MKRFKITIVTVLVLTLMLSSFANAQQPQDMTRVGFVKEILRAMDVEIDTGSSSPFTDILNKEDISYLGAAFNKKIVSGHGGEFDPDIAVTNEQAVIMLVRALGVLNIDADEASKTEINFSDEDQISSWAKPYISYALKYGLIENSENNFNPKGPVTKLEAQAMITNFKKAFIREGLTASQVLELADNKLKEYDSYKFKGSMDMSTIVKSPTGEEQAAISKLSQEGMFEAPETVYTISKNIAYMEGQLIEQVVEVYMKDRAMYIRTGENQEWIKIDVSPIMAQMESLMGSVQQGVPQLSSQQLEAVGMYARYGEDIEVDGEEYYVIKVDLDTDAFMEMYNKIMEETFNTMFEGEMWEEIKKEQGIPDTMDEETFKATAKAAAVQTLENMDIQMVQEYYIHKENKHYNKLMLKQLMKTDLMGVETSIKMDGQYEYYGFGEEVVFPEIN